jgi:prevent-host-death family protein
MVHLVDDADRDQQVGLPGGHSHVSCGHMAKARIGVRELKDKLSATLARVRRGEAVTVTDRNQPIAVIVPARAAEDPEAVVRTLATSGRLAWSGGKPLGLENAPRVRGPSVSDAVVEDRR